jgi:hypothetical protein
MPKTTTKTKTQSRAVSATIQLHDPERRAQIVAAFEARGYGCMSFSAMCRKLIDEWLEAQPAAPNPS